MDLHTSSNHVIADNIHLSFAGPLIGKGAFGEVYGVEVPYGPQALADLALPMDHPPFSTAMKISSTNSLAYQKELLALTKLTKAQHVVQLLRYRNTGDHAILFLELLQPLTLKGMLATSRATGQTLSTAAITHVLRGVAEGLGEIHRAGFVHADVKPGNVGFTAGLGVKLFDLGLARCTDDVGGAAGTAGFWAPEVGARGVVCRREGWAVLRGLAVGVQGASMWRITHGQKQHVLVDVHIRKARRHLLTD